MAHEVRVEGKVSTEQYKEVIAIVRSMWSL